MSELRCDKCEEVFLNVSKLIRHVLESHEEKMPEFRC